mmetsp:Transcript_19016/g.48553  ORF Transcript_19016/g.48553 Transcript_19016/m.48553 type:complete len:102 (-) Transcript_19016:1981-2286(-)
MSRTAFVPPTRAFSLFFCDLSILMHAFMQCTRMRLQAGKCKFHSQQKAQRASWDKGRSCIDHKKWKKRGKSYVVHGLPSWMAAEIWRGECCKSKHMCLRLG